MRENGGWLRLYTDISENPKLRRLSESTQLFFVWCLCLHKRGWLVGKTDGEIAFALRLKPAVTVKRLNELKEANLLLSDNTPKGWSECQFASDSSKERVRAHRDRVLQERYSNGDVTAGVTGSAKNAERYGNGTDQIREEQSRGEQTSRAREGGDGELGGTPQECGTAVTGEAGELVERCRVALGKLLECGPEWAKLSLERLVELVRAEPRADLGRVVDRIRKDWMGQGMPVNKTPPMIVRQCLGWDAVDGDRSATKNAPRLPTVEELRERRIGGGK